MTTYDKGVRMKRVSLGVVASLAAVVLLFAIHSYGVSHFKQRLGTDTPNRFFVERIQPGLRADEVAVRMPEADTVEYYLRSGTDVVERHVYKVLFARDYHVNVIYGNGIVIDVEVSDEWLRELQPISREQAEHLLGDLSS